MPRLAKMVWLGALLAVPVIVRAERLPIKTYTTADGLPRDQIMGIVRDSQGFLWFCTADGLSRFDGYTFTNYGVEHGLPHPTINDLLETRNGVYWVATNGGGVCRFNPNPIENQTAKGQGPKAKTAARRPSPSAIRPLFTVYPVGDESPTNRVNGLFEDRTGQLWAGTDAGLFRLEETNGRGTFRRVALSVPSYPDRLVGVFAFAEDREGSLWIGTGWGLVRRLPDGRMIHYTIQPSPGGDQVRALLQDREGRLWVGHRGGGLILLNPSQLPTAGFGLRIEKLTAPTRSLTNPPSEIQDPKSVNSPSAIRRPPSARWYTTAEGLANNNVWGLHQASDGQIWIATNGGGLSVFDGHRFRNYTTAQGLSDNMITALTEDRNGNLWVGTSTGGAMKIAWNGFTTYGPADGLDDGGIASIFENQAGELCVISPTPSGHYLNRFDGRRFTAIQPNLPKQIQYFGWGWNQIIFQDHTGQWWVPTGEGLCRFPKVSRVEQLAHTRLKAIYTTRNGLPGNDVFRLFEDARGDIWISLSSDARNALTRWERATETFHVYSEADGLPSYSPPMAFCEDRSSDLWIGFYNGELARYRDGRFTLLTAADGPPAGQIRTLYLDHAGRLWAATSQSGLSRLDDPGADRPRFVTYTVADGLASNYVGCITEDQWGRIYIGTGRGVDRLDLSTGRLNHYTAADGLANNAVTVAFRDRHGALWFGTHRGLSRLIPQPDRPVPPPPLLISGLRINGVAQPVSELGQIDVSVPELGPDQRQVQIDFVGLGFGSGEALRYQYKLEGTDQDWGALTDHRTVNYASLSPGTYRFIVRAVSADGGTSPTPATVAFSILPPIWQRWWFLTLAAMFAGLVVYASYRYRVARLLELERVRTRIATDLHDDIGASLSEMAILSEVVKHQIGVHHPESAQRLTEMAEKARELVDTMSDIVWSIDPRRDDLKNLVYRIRQFASSVLEAKRLAWSFQILPELENVKLTPEQRRHLLLIFKEAINNIVRHADCAAASLALTVTDNRLVAEIRDDGCGFALAPSGDSVVMDHQGHGLNSMRARAAQLGGQLRIDSVPGHGTRLTLTVPL
jgi:ligand-binding sensor domain-containing protein/two-component sensor histidine kinase